MATWQEMLAKGIPPEQLDVWSNMAPRSEMPPVVGQGQMSLKEEPVPAVSAKEMSQEERFLRMLQNDPAMKAYQKKLNDQMALQEAGIDESRNLTEQYKALPQKTDLSPLMALSDTWFGGNLQKGYRRPESDQERLMGISQLQRIPQQERQALINNLSKLADVNLSQKALMGMYGKKEKETGTQERFDEKRVSELSNRMEKSGLAELDPVIENINSVIPKEGDIPGFGQTAIFPDAAISPEGQSVRAAVSGLRNIILKARSGGAVTPQEADRMLQEIGGGIGRNDNQLRIGIANVTKQLAAKKQAILGGYPAEVKQEFSNRGGNVSIPGFGGAEERVYQGKKYRLKPGADRSKQESWEVVK